MQIVDLRRFARDVASRDGPFGIQIALSSHPISFMTFQQRNPSQRVRLELTDYFLISETILALQTTAASLPYNGYRSSLRKHKRPTHIHRAAQISRHLAAH